MKYKKLFLVLFLLLLFVLQQAKVGAEGLLKLPAISPLAFNPPTSVSVTFYHLQPDGKLQLTRGKPTTCSLRKNNNVFDDSYGCTQYAGGGYFWSYPYPTNSYNVPVETDYLLDVLSHEMDPHTYPNSQAEEAQAVASRTFAYNKNPLTNFGDPNGYVGLKASQLDIPFAFEMWIANPYAYNYPNNSNYPCQSTNLTILQSDVCNAVTPTQGYYSHKTARLLTPNLGMIRLVKR